jgi:cysteine-rich repeat protein
MKTDILKLTLVGLLSLFALACGAPAGDAVDEDPALGEDFEEHDGDNIEDENVDEEDLGVEEEDLGVEGPFCGDGFVDDDEACDDGNDLDGDGCSSACEVETFEGETEGDIVLDLIIDDLGSNEEPLATGCTGTIAVSVTDDILFGDGSCALPNNFLDYTVSGQVDEDGVVDGDIVITLNNRPHALSLTGALEDGVMSLGFDGVTLITSRIRGVWDGTIVADFD